MIRFIGLQAIFAPILMAPLVVVREIYDAFQINTRAAETPTSHQSYCWLLHSTLSLSLPQILSQFASYGRLWAVGSTPGRQSIQFWCSWLWPRIVSEISIRIHSNSSLIISAFQELSIVRQLQLQQPTVFVRRPSRSWQHGTALLRQPILRQRQLECVHGPGLHTGPAADGSGGQVLRGQLRSQHGLWRRAAAARGWVLNRHCC